MPATAGWILRPTAKLAAFQFTTTQSPYPGAVAIEGGFSLSDATFASGANFGWDNNLPAADWTALGLTALAFTAFFPTAAGPSTLTATLADLGPSGPRNAPPYWRLSLASDPGRDPTGWMFFTDNFSSFSVQFQGTASIGIIGSDNGGPCSPASNCTIAATLMRVAVPEPPTLALLGAWVRTGSIACPMSSPGSAGSRGG